MNDVISGIVVALVTAVAVAGIFLLTSQAKKKRIAALRDLCLQRGWTYRYDSGSLYHGHRIEGDGWAFEAVSRSGGRETAPGSSDWGHSTQWRAAGEEPGPQHLLILGSRPGGMMDVSRLPLSLLSRFLGDEIAGLQPIDAGGALAGKIHPVRPGRNRHAQAAARALRGCSCASGRLGAAPGRALLSRPALAAGHGQAPGKAGGRPAPHRAGGEPGRPLLIRHTAEKYQFSVYGIRFTVYGKRRQK